MKRSRSGCAPQLDFVAEALDAPGETDRSKVVVATSERELPALDKLLRRGTANGVSGLAMIGAERLRKLKPHAAGVRALRVPATSITEYSAIARKLAELVSAASGVVLTGTKVVGIQRRTDGLIVRTTRGDHAARFPINRAGLYSDRISRVVRAIEPYLTGA